MPKEQQSVANQIHANGVARCNGYGGAVYIDGQYRPYSGNSPWYDPNADGVMDMSDEELDDYLHDRYPDWH